MVIGKRQMVNRKRWTGKMSTNMRMDSLFSRFLYFVICLTGFTGKTLLLSEMKRSMNGTPLGSFFRAGLFIRS